MWEFQIVMGHVEVYKNGVFQFSADTMQEAMDEVDGLEKFGWA